MRKELGSFSVVEERPPHGGDLDQTRQHLNTSVALSLKADASHTKSDMAKSRRSKRTNGERDGGME